MNNENDDLNPNEFNNKSEINKLRNDIEYLNSQIIDKLNSIFSIDCLSHDKFNIMNSLKDILLSQREEIIEKNDDIKRLELKIVDFARNITFIGEKDSSQISENSINGSHGKIEELNTIIEELLKKNAENQEIINKLREEINPEFWEEQISDLNKLIIDLKEENTSLGKNLENSNKRSNVEQIEKEIIELKHKISELEDENKKVEEKNRMLKAALLMTVDTETKNISDSSKALTEDSVIEFDNDENKNIAFNEGSSEVKQSQEVLESTERKRQCPKCGAAGAFILEIDDKSNVIFQDMGTKIYGKKYKCGDCGYEWR